MRTVRGGTGEGEGVGIVPSLPTKVEFPICPNLHARGNVERERKVRIGVYMDALFVTQWKSSSNSMLLIKFCFGALTKYS